MLPQTVTQLLEFIAGLAVLIFLHEMGHYLAARWLKVDVEEFGIGFPPRAVKLFEAGGTIFSLNWIPLGGFVRIKGENDPDVPGGLASATPWVRLAVLSAGPLMNIAVGVILAVIFFFSLGEPDKVNIGGISPASPAEQAGLQVGDIILRVNGEEVRTQETLHDAIYNNLGVPITIVYQRGGQTFEVSLIPRDPPPPDGAIGIAMGYTTKPTTWPRAIQNGFLATFEYARGVVLLPVRMIQGDVTPEESRPIGYKGMFDIYQQLSSPLWFFMVISLSLGVFNLFPIPALDGGRILFTLPELLFRKRIPARYENAVHLVGFTLLILLLIYINVQDFVNPVQLPR
jgi:regulator of sigma E protease